MFSFQVLKGPPELLPEDANSRKRYLAKGKKIHLSMLAKDKKIYHLLQPEWVDCVKCPF